MGNLTEENKNQIIKCLKWAIIAILTLGVLKCGSDIAKELNAPKTPINDSTSISIKHDTIWSKADTIYSFETKKKFIYLVDTVYKPIIITPEECNLVRLSVDSLDDKNITIYDSTVFQGVLRSKSTSYKLKVPLEVVTTIEKTEHIPVLYTPEYQLNAGLSVSTNLLAPTVSVGYKRHTIGLGYNIQNKQPILQYSFRLWHSKK